MANNVRGTPFPPKMEESKFREPYISQFLSYLRKGVTLRTAAKAAGITYQTVLNWRKLGEREMVGKYAHLGPDEYPKHSYAAFVVAMDRAEAEFILENYDQIGEISRGGALVKRVVKRAKDGTEVEEEQYSAPQWQGLAWRVERAHRDYQLQSSKSMEEGTPQIQIIFTNDWRRVNARAGQIVDTVEGEVLSTRPLSLEGGTEDANKDGSEEECGYQPS